MTPLTLEDAETNLAAALAHGDPNQIAAATAQVDKLDRPAPAVPMLSAALWYASLDFKVFPLSAGSKIPFKGSNGCKGATSDVDTITAWWTANPTANIGLATGHLVDVVDIDGLEGQRSRAQHWDDLFAKIDADSIAEVLTPRAGGMHIYVAATGDGNAAGLLPGVDYRGAGGYVVAPPSVTDIGRYRFLGTPTLEQLTSKAVA